MLQPALTRPAPSVYSAPNNEMNMTILSQIRAVVGAIGHMSGQLHQTLKTASSGFVEGLYLIIKYPYVLHILGVTCLYEIVLTVMDYRFKLLGSLHTSEGGKMFHEDSEDMNDFANLLGHFG